MNSRKAWFIPCFGVALVASAATPRQVQRTLSRTYEASAYVSFLSIPLVSREAVGGGFAALNETVGDDLHLLSIRFVAGSTPERARGLNRLGFIEEKIQERSSGTAIEYFGFMTANRESSLAEAKAALASESGDAALYVAAKGVLGPACMRYSVHHVTLPASYRWNDSQTLTNRVQAHFTSEPAPMSQELVKMSGSEGTGTFLYAVWQAIVSTPGESDRSFVHNGRIFRLYTVKSCDPKEGEDLARAGMVASASDVERLKGTIRNGKSKEETAFQLWFDEKSGNPLPLRFEFRPKSYLKLVFQAKRD